MHFNDFMLFCRSTSTCRLSCATRCLPARELYTGRQHDDGNYCPHEVSYPRKPWRDVDYLPTPDSRRCEPVDERHGAMAVGVVRHSVRGRGHEPLPARRGAEAQPSELRPSPRKVPALHVPSVDTDGLRVRVALRVPLTLSAGAMHLRPSLQSASPRDVPGEAL